MSQTWMFPCPSLQAAGGEVTFPPRSAHEKLQVPLANILNATLFCCCCCCCCGAGDEVTPKTYSRVGVSETAARWLRNGPLRLVQSPVHFGSSPLAPSRTRYHTDRSVPRPKTKRDEVGELPYHAADRTCGQTVERQTLTALGLGLSHHGVRALVSHFADTVEDQSAGLRRRTFCRGRFFARQAGG